MSMSLVELISEVQARFLRHLELAYAEDRAVAVQGIRDGYAENVEEADREFASWQALSDEARQVGYEEYLQTRARMNAGVVSRAQAAPADLDTREAEVNMAAWPDPLLYLRAAVLAEIGEQRVEWSHAAMSGAPRRAPRQTPSFAEWCAREEETLRAACAEARDDQETGLRILEADLAFLTYVDEFLATNTANGVLPTTKE